MSAPHFPPSDDFEVRVYSTAMCVPCDHLKAELREAGIPFTLYDPMVDDDAAEFLESQGLRSVPVLTVGADIYPNYRAGLVGELFG